jgi:dTDP-L-rhamnose 4-epimerase
MATAVFLERLVSQDPPPNRLVVASSMSIYGEGEYECDRDGRVGPLPRPEENLLSRAWELACPVCGREVRPTGTTENKPLIPTSIYAVNKRDHEEMCLIAGAAYGVATVALRFFNVYGPGQALSNPYTGVAAIFASRLLNGRAPVVFEDGDQSRDFIHVRDIVRGILLALESEDAVGRAVNLGTGRATTVVQMAQLIAAGLQVEIEPELSGHYRAGDIRHCYADPSLARSLLGFEATVPLEEGMQGLLDWLRLQEPTDRVDTAIAELSARGLAR